MKFSAALWRSESAQASVEYILLLFAVVVFFLLLVKTLQPIYTSIVTQLSNKLKSSISSTGLYSFPLGK
jgi:hypothetical protein